MTRATNSGDRIRSGLLTNEQAAGIRERMPFGPPYVPFALELANELSINYLTVCNIAAGLSYKRPKACPPNHPLRLALNTRNAERQRIRGQVKLATRKAIGDAQNWRCVYCDADITGRKSSIDHITPVSQGGTSEITNLQLLCRRCNSSKGDRNDEEYRAELARRAEYVERLDADARRVGFSSHAAYQAFEECPCHHYGCPPGCPSCEMCAHPPGEPEVINCPVGEFGIEQCLIREQCRSSQDCQDPAGKLRYADVT